MHRITLPFILVAALISNAGCGGGSGAQPPPPNTMTVSIAHAASRTLDASQSYPLTATVSNDRNNGGVKWTITCPSGVSACGGMTKASTSSGVPNSYNAPSNVSAAETVTVIASSASDSFVNAAVRLTVNQIPALVSPAPAQPPPGNVGQPFSLDLTQYVQAGSAPFTWSVKSGALPAGLTLDKSTGLVSGTPTSTASFASQRHAQLSGVRVATAGGLVFTEMDSGNPPMFVNVSISLVIDPPLTLTISPSSGALPSGIVGVDYKVRRCYWRYGCHYYPIFISLAGGVQPYTLRWAAMSGSSTPPGLSLLGPDSGSSNGIISGMPTAAGTYNFAVTVTDAQSPPKQATATYTLTIAAPSPSPSSSP